MKTLIPLVAMQLKDKLDFNPKANWKATLFKTIFAILKFVIITGLIYVGMSVLSMLRLISLGAGIPDKFLLILFTAMLSLSLLTCTVGLVKALYYAKDNQVLLTMPTSRINIFFSKIIVYYIYEFIRNLTFMLPVFVAFGLVNGYAIYYYLWALLSLTWITGLTVMGGALLSIPAMFISTFFKNFKYVLYVIVAGVIGVSVWGIVSVINMIPSNLNIIETWGTTFWQVQDFMTMFSQKVLPFSWVMESVVGYRYGLSHHFLYGRQWLCILGVLGTIAALIGICYLIVRPLFFHFASSPFEYKRSYKESHKKNRRTFSFFSALKTEILLYLRNSTKLFSLLGVAIGMPIAILLLNKIYGAMDTRLQGAYMTITFNVLVTMLLLLASSVSMARVYSEDGNAAYLLKTNPKPYFSSLFAKILPNMVVMTLSLIATVVVLEKTASGLINSTMLFFCLEGFYLGHLLWSAELDIMNPQIAQYAATGTHTNNPNEVKSTIYAFLISAFMAFLVFALIGEGVTMFWIKAMILGIVFFIARLYLYVMKIKVYYKEK